MLSVALKEFRSETGGSVLALSPKDLQWCCTDDGSINTLKINDASSEEWSDTQVGDDLVITALAINPSSTQCAIAYGKTVYIHEYPSVENVISSSIYRSEMNISKIEYDSTGQYM